MEHELSYYFSLHSDWHKSSVALSNRLKCFPFVPNNGFNVGTSPLSISPTSLVQAQSCSLSSSFPFLLSSYQVLHGSVYSFPVIRDSCQLSAINVFLTHAWREMYSTSTYSPAILFSSRYRFLSFPNKPTLLNNFNIYPILWI